MEFKDYYKILGVERGASADELKRAYRKLARQYHPDVSKAADAEARFKEMKEAYEVLKDPEKRAAYDQYGKDWQSGQDFRPPPGDARGFGNRDSGFGERVDPGEFSEFFEAMFGRARGGGDPRAHAGRGAFRAAGQPIDARIRIPLTDAYHGATRQLSLDIPRLGDDGRMRTERRSLNVKIPRGVTAGQRIRLEGQGAPGIGGGAAGDLFLQVEFEPHPVFRAQGRDIHVRLPIAPWEAALGRTVQAPTLGGWVELKIPTGPAGRKSLRLKGRGLPGKVAGDQFVELEVVVPSASGAARSLYEQLEKDSSIDVRADIKDLVK
ncbi:MAG TPA: DnaJ C-terminal domain-containing protein [Steroidobacteraceae bacterium]|nr:DnaJ C-terminal domain-containing protein [Steroidobacteraceae bacterium]HRX89647.1 DnaJ C-terminal domain-containing protein [Steroidobacteraceae bacterium]